MRRSWDNAFKLALVASAVAAVQCGDGPTIEEDVTGVELEVTFDLELDRLQIEGAVQGEGSFEALAVPDEPRALDGAGETVVIVVYDELGGRSLDLEVRGLRSGVESAYGALSVELVTQELVSASLHLDCVGEGCGACDPSTCSSGCCADGDCVEPTVEECGTGGEACLACDQDLADGCSVDGECTCGGEEACAPGSRCANGLCVCDAESCPAGCCEGGSCLLRSFESCGSNGATCVACDDELSNSCSSEGECRCGTSPSCEPGQACLGGICICDTISCDGCCDGNTCFEPSLDHCGIEGSDCVVCEELRSDTCNDEGICQCGEGPPAGPGQRCEGGARVCDVDSCDGCCSDSENCEAPSLSRCGIDGDRCVACDPERADRCSGGVCRCGEGALCSEGQQCEGGLCVCNESSCPTGCCNGDVCEPGATAALCGAGGNECIACPDGDTCEEGVCSSCNSTSCSEGCCLGAECVTPTTVDACGTGGGACRHCGDTADTCSAEGLCLCGSGSACAPGQRCEAGACLCDALSCPDGCCDGDTCVSALTLDQCGGSGESCLPCDSTTADNCSTTGQCRCGIGPSCQLGQRCDGGTCICDSESCPDGCCSDNTCEPRSFTTCGIGGSLCASCSATRADECDASGECVCGGSAACDAGQRCLGGACVCDSISCAGCCEGDECLSGTTAEACGTSGVICQPCPEGVDCEGGACTNCNATTCPTGCCNGSDCIDPPSVGSCGRGGEECTACDTLTADSCVDGACRCGSSAPCPTGVECIDGACNCGPDSCPEGCCDGGVCQARSLTTCGVGGVDCVGCDELRADNCSSEGTCRCGASPICEEGQRCLSGACICDSISCAGCCQDNTCVPGDSDERCGSGGAACERCHPVFGRCLDQSCVRD